jgi:hypothetical protein
MHEAALAQAALPAPTLCFGLELRPYSLGHELFLIRELNPLLTCSDLSRVTRADLAQAVLICCQSFEECKRMHSDWFIGLKITLWRRRVQKMNFGRELQGFLDYRASGSLEFPLTERVRCGASPGRPAGAPFLLRLHQFLVTRLNKSDSAAWDYPLGLAKMHWLAYWESEGGVTIYNSHDAQFDRYCAEEDAKELAELKAKEAACRA